MFKSVTLFHIKNIFKIYLTGILFFTIFRIILFISQIEKFYTIPQDDRLSTLFQAMVMGLRFDSAVSGYLLLVPFIIFSVLSFLKHDYKFIKKILFCYLITVYLLSFLISAVNIPYFNQFFAHLSFSAFHWLEDSKFIFSMVFQESKYWVFFMPFIFTVVMFIFITKAIICKPYKNYNNQKSKNSLTKQIAVTVITAFIIFTAIRGRVAIKSPIRVGTAYFSNYSVANQLGLNPVFTLVRSTLDHYKNHKRELHFLNNTEAITNTQEYLKVESPNNAFPILRNITFPNDSVNKKNVVLIIMESMSAEKMKRFGNQENLTPNLDRFAKNGISFENFYSAGIHTYNGVYSSLFSYPALMAKHSMKMAEIPEFSGLSYNLKKHGYSTMYFTTHDGQFDNIEGFLKANHFDHIITQNDYPNDKVQTTLGVPDDYMFEFAIPKINEVAKSEEPFFSVLLTSSDHGPYYIPPYFIPNSLYEREQIVEYADWSLNKFIELASKQAWFKDTYFVFVADHGTAVYSNYELPLSCHHSPFVIYSPELITEHENNNSMSGQIDIFPSIMNLLKLPYANNSFGLDAFNNQREFIYFSSDNKLGVINEEYFLVVLPDGKEILYDYRSGSQINHADKEPELIKRMKLYAQSNLQACQWILENKKQFVE